MEKNALMLYLISSLIKFLDEIQETKYFDGLQQFLH